MVVIFTTRQALLRRRIAEAADAIFPDGCIWVGWPKKSSNMATDITEDIIREIALPLGLVDTKVGAIRTSGQGFESSGERNTGRRGTRGRSDVFRAGRPCQGWDYGARYRAALDRTSPVADWSPPILATHRDSAFVPTFCMCATDLRRRVKRSGPSVVPEASRW